ncbi:MAG: lysoplasmalogenase family protein [Candidatus Hodarchaeales archaeon]
MLSIYILLFGISAVFYIIISSIKKNEITFKNEAVDRIPQFLLVVFKIIPTTLGFTFALLMSESNTLFHVGIALALLFCVAGDVGMEISLIKGLSLFALAQLIFILVYTGQAITEGITPVSIFFTSGIIIIAFVYIVLFLKYLVTNEKGLGKLKIPVLMYSTFLSLHLITATLLWTVSGFSLDRMVVVAGALFFLVSDSTIGIREFHHEISFSSIKVMGTYYLCILLISAAVLVY